MCCKISVFGTQNLIMGVIFFLLTLLTFSVSYVVSSEKNVICYYGTWATYRWGNGKFSVEDVNPHLCTHLIYSFVGIDNQGNVISLDPGLDITADNFGKFNALKQKNPKLKTLLAVGGWNEGSGKYSIMAASASLRQNFISTALNFVQTYGFDGFDIDWEYPARRDSVHGSADIDNFTQLVKEMKEEFAKYGLLVTAAVSSVNEMASLSYDIQAICQYLDIVNLMTYDFYGAWDSVTGHNAGLHKGQGDEATPRLDVYSVDVAVEYWMEKGCPPEKLVIGLPFYGRTITLVNPNVNGVRAPASGAGIAGPYTVSAGSVGYNEFCNIMQSESGWEVHYDELAEVPYAVKGNNWVSYDDAHSLAKKIEWGLTKNVAGIMLWSIETDDFKGVCGEDYPLLRAINKALGRDVDGNETVPNTEAMTEVVSTEGVSTTEVARTETPTTAEPTMEAAVSTEGVSTTEDAPTETPTTAEPTTEAAVSPEASAITESTPKDLESVCVVEGITSNPYDCSRFIMCIREVDGDLYPVVFNCPPELQFNPNDLFCDYPSNVRCTV